MINETELNEFMKNKKKMCDMHTTCKECILLVEKGSGYCASKYGELTQKQIDAVMTFEPPIDWSRVPINTRVVVWLDRLVQHKRYFAGYNDGKICTFQSGATSWSNEPTPLEKWTYGRLAEEDE